MRKKLLFLPLLVVSLAGVSTFKLADHIQVLSVDETIDNVKIGDVFEVEQRVLEYEGQRKTVDGQIILPDGTSKEGKQFTITMPGIYSVNYRAFFGAHEVSVSKFYHCHRTSADFFTSSDTRNKPQTGEYSHPIKSGEIKGAKLILDSKTTFTYEREIDFSTYGSVNSFIDVIVDTSQTGTSDLETFTIRLTDVEDNNNYVDITVTDGGPIDDDGRGCYILAGSNNQFKTGYEGSRLHIGKYGANVGMSFRNLPEKSARVAKFYFDYADRKFYVSPLLNEGGAKGQITDLDDKSVYGSNIWEGFTTGKARLSIFANSLSNSSATLIVSKIANIDLSPLDFVDNVKPTISIDYDGQAMYDLPKASVNKPYKLYKAVITDNFDKDLSYSTYVTHFDSVNSKNKDISVINNTFTPKEEGTYKISYIAKDHSNNQTIRELVVTTINDPQTMSLSIDTPSISQELYSKINLPLTSDVHVTGGSGVAKVTRTLLDNKSKEIQVEDDTFIPEKIGSYTALYKATDYIGNIATLAVPITVTDPGHPIFVGEPSLPRILIKGHKYALPSYPGVEVVNNETVSLSSKVYVNGSHLTNSTFVAGSTCLVKYELSGTRGTQTYQQNIDVVESGSPMNFANYFYGDFAKAVHTSDIALTANTGTATDIFASILPFDNPYIKFAVDPNNINFERLIFKFSDSSNPNNSISFKIRFSAGKAYVSAGSDTSEYEFGKADLGSDYSYAIDFLSSSRVLSDINHNELVVVKNNDQGKPFNGFSNGLYLDITMENISSSSSLKVLSISNQVIGDLSLNPYLDAFPIIILNDKFVNEQHYGDNVFIPTASIFDVLSDSSVTVSVKAPNNTYKIQDLDAGITHSFKLDQFGQYTVIYNGRDEEGNTASFRRTITIYDFNAPEITITGSLKESYKLNDEISIPSYTVSDNQNDYKLDVFLIMPDNQQRLLLTDKNGTVTSYLEADSMVYNSSFKVNSTTFKAEQYGKYTMRFVAYDSDFNKSAKELNFEVK